MAAEGTRVAPSPAALRGSLPKQRLLSFDVAATQNLPRCTWLTSWHGTGAEPPWAPRLHSLLKRLGFPTVLGTVTSQDPFPVARRYGLTTETCNARYVEFRRIEGYCIANVTTSGQLRTLGVPRTRRQPAHQLANQVLARYDPPGCMILLSP